MTNHLTKRGNIYYFRRKIPADLQEQFQRKQIMFSLNTHDYSQAKRLAATHTVLTDAEFAAARSGNLSESDKVAESVRASVSAALVAATSERRRDQIERAQLEADEQAYEQFYRTEEQEIAEHDRREDLIAQEVERLLAEREALRRLRQAESLETGPSPQMAPLIVAQRAKNLRDVIPSWARRTSADTAAVKRAEKALSLFEEAVGIVPLRELNKGHGAQFVAFLLDTAARGFKAKTAHNHASYIAALLNVAEKDDLIDRNPLDLSIDKSIGAKRREPWSDAELKRMYEHSLFSHRMNDVPEWQDVKPVDGRALVLILQHTGARIGEIAQLRRGDFETRDGITAIRITAEAGTVKTAESERTVPLANHLLADVWFSAWLAEVMDGKRLDTLAFPSMAGRARGPADTAVQWFKEFREAAGLPSGALNGSHKFRHWIRTAMNALDVAEATQDAITGHAAGGSTGKKVYTHVPLPVMHAALNRVTFPEIFAR
ncbi:integrase [Paraburkholderia tropica]|uniref:DUF6538 domain-containing protein n=1 Tax=Paraburkholderia tropica TaxID=92647 RepID=UPI00160F165B|nr:DUF6538 domain-containing protein [Paraburkholderia tropica]MBB2999791.1 integrase [Paraburkholderia tropica]